MSKQRILYKDIHNLGKKPYRYIYPTHQLAVKKLIDKLPKININKIILFGSLLDFSAGQESDIDRDYIEVKKLNETIEYKGVKFIPGIYSVKVYLK